MSRSRRAKMGQLGVTCQPAGAAPGFWLTVLPAPVRGGGSQLVVRGRYGPHEGSCMSSTLLIVVIVVVTALAFDFT
ncbi:MAG: hypothetical protein DI580_09150, partial [Cutibacterium acnes]